MPTCASTVGSGMGIYPHGPLGLTPYYRGFSKSRMRLPAI